MNDAATVEAIHSLSKRRHLTQPHLEKWLAMESASRRALLEIADRLKLRTGQLVTAIELLDEISIREAATPAAILAREEVRRACSLDDSGPSRAAAFLGALRAIRFPRLRRTMDRMSAEVAALKLPRELRIMLPKDLNSDELTVQISARTERELGAAIDALTQKKSGIVRLAKLLGGGHDDEQ
jgi:hypothetical protein